MTELQPHRGILHDTARNAPGQQYWHSGQDAFGAYFPGLDVGPVWDWDGDGVANAEPPLTLTPDETTGPPAGDGEDGEATRPNKAYKIDDAPGLESPEFALNFDNDSDDFDRDDPTPHVAIPIKIKEKTALPNKKGKIEIKKSGDTYLIGLWLSDEDYGLYRPTGLPEAFGQLLDLSQEDINNTWGA